MLESLFKQSCTPENWGLTEHLRWLLLLILRITLSWWKCVYSITVMNLYFILVKFHMNLFIINFTKNKYRIRVTKNQTYLKGCTNNLTFIICRSSRPKVFCKKSVLRNFTKFTAKKLPDIFLNKIAGLGLQLY